MRLNRYAMHRLGAVLCCAVRCRAVLWSMVRALTLTLRYCAAGAVLVWYVAPNPNWGSGLAGGPPGPNPSLGLGLAGRPPVPVPTGRGLTSSLGRMAISQRPEIAERKEGGGTREVEDKSAVAS